MTNFNSLAYLISVLGLSLFICSKSRIRPAFGPFLANCWIITVVFIGGLWGRLPYTAGTVKALGIALFAYYVARASARKNLRTSLFAHFKDNGYFIALVLISPFLFKNQIVGHGDEYTHYAAICKDMFFSNRLLDASSAVFYKNYHPGMSLFLYYVIYGGSYSEPLLYVAATALNFSAINCVFARFRNYRVYSFGLTLVFTQLAFKCLGLGIKSLIADQFFICGYFGALVFIFFGPKHNKWLLIFPLLAISINKQFGDILSLTLLATFAAFEYHRVHLSKGPKRTSIAFLSSTVAAFAAIIYYFSHRWDGWVKSHDMLGLFFSDMQPGNVTSLLVEMAKLGVTQKQSEIIRGFLPHLIQVPMVFLEVDPPNVARAWSFGGWFALFSAILVLVHLKPRRVWFSIWFWIVPILSLLAWIVGILILNLRVFAFTHEGPYPSMDRYLGTLFSPLFLFACYLLYVKSIVIFKGRCKSAALVGLMGLAIIAPSAPGFPFSDRELTQGRTDHDFFQHLEIPKSLTRSDTVCLLYETRNDTYVLRAVYELLPAHLERFGPVSDQPLYSPEQFRRKCTQVLGFCVTSDDCDKASVLYPKSFTTGTAPQLWLMNVSRFLAW